MHDAVSRDVLLRRPAAAESIGEDLIIQSAFDKIRRLIVRVVNGQLPPAVSLAGGRTVDVTIEIDGFAVLRAGKTVK